MSETVSVRVLYTCYLEDPEHPGDSSKLISADADTKGEIETTEKCAKRLFILGAIALHDDDIERLGFGDRPGVGSAFPDEEGEADLVEDDENDNPPESEAPPSGDEPQVSPYESMTVATLKATAKEREVPLSGATTHPELVALLDAADAAAEQTPAETGEGQEPPTE